MKKYLLIIALFFVTNIWGQNNISFKVYNLLAGPAKGNWMFEFDDANYRTDDENPYTQGGVLLVNNFAYKKFTWSDYVNWKRTSTYCAFYNLPNILDDTSTIKLKLYNFNLAAFKHVNTVNPNNAWNDLVSRDAGDQRIYSDGIGEIYVNNNLVLKVNNCRLTVKTPYPTAAQSDNILAQFIPGYSSHFAKDIGTGEAVTGNGWGTIVTEESNPNWITALDPNGTGQVKYTLSTISSIIQTNYGFFNFDILVEPTTHQEIIESINILDLKTTDVSFIKTGITTSFTNPLFFDDTLRYVFTSKIKTNPGGSNPIGISNIYDGYYWQLGTNFTQYDFVNVTFEISDIPGINNLSDLRVLRRSEEGAGWEILNTTKSSKGTVLQISNLTSLGEFAIGSVGSNNPLPVELTSFEANVTNNDVTLTWETATELNNFGFEVERKKENEDWKKIGFIEGNGNSNSIKNYLYIDKNLAYGKYLYRLKQVDNDGKFEYSNQVESEIINLNFNVSQNYPNPFNPITTISFSLPTKEVVTLKIYDSLGKEITTLVNEELSKGVYEKTWDASLYGSGVYYYRITAGGFSKTCKMLLVK